MKTSVRVIITIILCLLFAVLGFVLGFLGTFYLEKKDLKGGAVSGKMNIHFIDLDSYYTGDCTFIDIGDVEVLIDAGSKIACIDTIDDYIDDYVDGKLDYVIVTHAHEDHYAGFAYNGDDNGGSLFNRYEIGTIIDFAQTNQKLETAGGNKTMYANYLDERQQAIDAGAVHYTAKECVDKTNGATDVFALSEHVSMTILDQKFYHEKESSGENNHSVCTLFTQGNRNFLFTGDLEEEGEESLAEKNDLPQVELYKAGHHGSKTSSHDVMLKEIKPKMVCVCCCAGTSEYTKTNANQFPTQEFIDRIAPYTDKVYVTTMVDNDEEKTFKPMNGNIVVSSGLKGVTINCSNNDTLLKDTAWFIANREMPNAWKESVA